MAKGINVIGILIILVGAFMLLSGIGSLTGETNGMNTFLNDIGARDNPPNIIVAVLQIVGGALLIASRFISIGALDGILRIALLVIWIIVMLFAFILNGRINNIDTLAWWAGLVNSSIILVILWMIKE